MEIIVNNIHEGVDIMNKKREADLAVMANKLYNSTMQQIKVMELNEVETSKVLEILISMYKKHFINYD